MDEKTVAGFYQLINNLIDEKLSKQDKIEICQIVSDDNGSGKYNIRLLSGENTIIHDVVSSRKTSFKNGDYAYILKIHNKLSNAIIIGSNTPRIKQKVAAKEETSANYKVFFTLGDYVLSGFLSTNPGATWGSPSGTSFPAGTQVYYFVQIFPDDASYRYECDGINISGDIYRIGSVTVRNEDINLGDISNVTRYNAGQYPINANIVNGSLGSSSASTIQEGTTATVYIVPDSHYDMPLQNTITVTGCGISSYNISTGALVISKLVGDTDPVTISVTCISTEKHSLTFNLDSHITRVMWSLNGEPQTPVTSTTTLSNVLTYGDNLQWYAVPNQHYTTIYDSTNPYTVTKVTQDLSYNVVSALVQCAVTFTLGDYVTNAFTSINENGTNPHDSGYKYEYGTRVYYFVEKYANTSTDIYTCSGTWVSGNTYRLGYIDVTETNGDLGALSGVTHSTVPVLPDPVIQLTWSNYHSTILVKVTNPSGSPANVEMFYEYEYDTQTGTVSGQSQFASEVAPGSYATFYINQNGTTGPVESGYLTISFDGSPGAPVQPSNKTISLTPKNITTTVSHGSVMSGSDTKIWPQDSAYIYIQPASNYSLPNDVTVSGSGYDWDSTYSTNIGLLELFDATSDVAVSVTCSYNPPTYSLTFNVGTGVSSYLYSLYSYDDYQGPFNTNKTITGIVSGSDYYFYIIPASGYVTNYPQSDPCVGEITTQSKIENLANYVFHTYSYTTGSKTGISSLITYRTSSPYNQATIGALSSSDTIYAGDHIYFAATASSGYSVSTDYYDASHTLTVTESVVAIDYISVTQQALNAPTVGLAWGLYKDYVHVIVKNPSSNPTVNLSYYTSYETSTDSYDDDGTVGQITSGGSNVFEISAPGEIMDGYVDATISASGYPSYTVEEDFFNSGSSLATPTISISYNAYRDIVTITISNPSANPVLTCSWYGEYDNSTQTFNDYGIITIAPNGTGTITLNAGAGAIQQGFVDLTFKATGYKDYITSRSF